MIYEPDERMKHVDQLEDLIVESLGIEGALNAITRALDYDTKSEIYEYIVRVDLGNPEE